MELERELPRLLREAGIATEEQAEALADKIAELLDREDWSAYGAAANGPSVRSDTKT
jgi:hypothetical protein